MAKASADIRSLARSHTEKAIKVLVGVMNQSKAPAAARVAAANAVLDRGWGKAPQTLDLGGEVKLTHQLSPELAELVDDAVEKAGSS